MSSQYRNNHYVPQWYQRRFVPTGQINQELYYLELKPGVFVDPRGVTHKKKPRRQGFKYCFAKEDLYTTKLGQEVSTAIEQYFFGPIDHKGHKAVDYYTKFNHPSVDGDAFNTMVLFMSTQKLRTPKGLDWLSSKIGTSDRSQALQHMLRLRQLHSAIWTECIWQIADADQSDTKFIISDHPITVYNRKCGPRSHLCRGSNDPDIWLNATHTIFPLTLNKILILTNRSWVMNPHQSEVEPRPNPTPFRPAIMGVMDIQTMRHLSEQEVREINFIIKMRAYKHIAAGKEEWLYPEEFISKSNWNTYGHGYLLMPDPRAVHAGGETIIGYNDGSVEAFDAYGRRPWQPEYDKESKDSDEFISLHRFQGEFANLFGPYRRGRSFQMAMLDPERDNDEMHKLHLSYYTRGKKDFFA